SAERPRQGLNLPSFPWKMTYGRPARESCRFPGRRAVQAIAVHSSRWKPIEEGHSGTGGLGTGGSILVETLVGVSGIGSARGGLVHSSRQGGTSPGEEHEVSWSSIV